MVSMKLKFSWWSAAIGFLMIMIALSVAGIINVDATGIFWIVVTIACIWAMFRLFLKK
jgi:hypothetical protein